MFALERISDSVKVQTWNALPGKINMKPHGANVVQFSPHVGMEIEGHRVIEYDPPAPTQSLPDVVANLLRRIDADAEDVRLKYITPGDGMAMTYREKFEQAELVNEIGETAANALSLEDRNAAYPTLSASVGLEAATLWECAQLVRTAYAQFAQLSHVIEKTRLSGKASVSAATTVAEAQAAYEAIQWTV